MRKLKKIIPSKSKYNQLQHINCSRNFHDETIGNQIKTFDEIRRIATGQEDGYTAGRLLYYKYIKDHYQLISVDFNKKKELDADLRTVQQIELYRMLGTKAKVFTILEKAKETMLEFSEGTAKVLWILSIK